MLTIGDIASKRARLDSQACALVDQGREFTYGELDERVNRLANALLHRGLRAGDRVAILSENSHCYIEILFAVARAGLVSVSLNFRLTESDLGFMLNDSGARAVFVSQEFETVGASLRTVALGVDLWFGAGGATVVEYDALLGEVGSNAPAVAVNENDLAILMYTGGTTGLPKGVMLSHRNLISAFTNIVVQFGFHAQDVTLMVLPMFHVAVWQVFCHLMVGAKVVLMGRPDVGEILELLQAQRCTNMNAVPTLYNWIVNDPRVDTCDLRSLRLLVYGGSPFPEEVLRKCIARFGPTFAQGYGLTEAAPTVCFLGPEDHVLDGPRSRLLRSAGREMLLTEVRIADADGHPLRIGEVGEVQARGANVMLGYWNNEALTRERLRDGWLRTGDIGQMDDRGYVFLLDRKADMIVTGGENVYPSEVERVLHTHAAVKECIVASAPDECWGERVQAAVVLQGAAQVSEDELLRFCREHLAAYKCPKRIEFWEELPRSPVGKLLRKDVKTAFWDGRERQIN